MMQSSPAPRPRRPAPFEVSPEERAAIEAAYAAESARLLRSRIVAAAGLFILLVGIGVLFEATLHPGRSGALAIVYPIQVLVCALGILATRRAALQRWTRATVTAMAVVLDGLTLVYATLGGIPVERSAMIQTAFLTGVAIVLPWGPAPQLILVVASSLGFLLVGPQLPASDALGYAALTVAGVGATTVYAALFLERYRHDAFVRTALLDRVSATRQEEAEISAALLHVGEVLNAHLDRPDMLERVTRLAAELLDVDYCTIFVCDERHEAFRLREAVGLLPAVRSELEQLEFRPGGVTLGPLQPGRVLDVSDLGALPEAAVALLRRWDVSAVLSAPISRGEHIIGILSSGYRTRPGPFSSMQHRLAQGIAHATAIALENARLIEHLQGASRLKSEFVATMSHELRTPLNVIMGYTDLLAEGAFGALEASQQDTIVRIQQNAHQLFELVNATLDLGRLEAGREPVTLGPVDPSALFAELGREVEALVPAGVELRWQNALGEEPILTDRAKVKTILKNLLGNALKFTAKGSVTVMATWERDAFAIAVADTGIGIAAEQLPNIFEMFRQVDSSHTRRFGGVGLGLHIVKRLVELLGGTVAVKSTPGAGSTFTVTLPTRLARERRAAG
jgi:signal transduction histidine kinase